MGGRGVIYRLFRALWKAALFAFFRRVSVQGRENVPDIGPVLFVANHTNAFVDPLLILTRIRRPVSLTAKSTLRRNPLLAMLMRALNVIELHRAQDTGEGADPAKNVDALAACRRRLEEGGTVCIFPEGVSHSDPALRPFKSGAARMALDFVEADAGPLLIVPVGLHFEAKERFRSEAAVVFGAPFEARAWRRAHPNADARALTDEMERRIRALTTNFAAEGEAETFARAAELLVVADAAPPPLGRETAADVAARVSVVHRLQAGRARLAAARPAELARLEERVNGLYAELSTRGITAPELFLPMEGPRAAFFVFREMEILLVGAPVAAWGWLNHLAAYAVLRALVKKLSKDRDHFASNAVVLSLPVIPLFYLLQAAAFALLTRSAGWTVLYALSLPYAAAVGLLYRDRAGSVRRRAGTFLYFLRHREKQRTLAAEARAISDEIRRLDAVLEGHG
jgi:glycerol-3-phosphate O-acyltransferase/dihydroxyacetone phosphate acyltransferase